jgi:hypothetical protein
MMPKNFREVVAHHEAGHAVIAWDLGCMPDQVSIAPIAGHSEGRVIYRGLLSRVDFDDLRKYRGCIEDAIVIALAGPLTQRRYSPRS